MKGSESPLSPGDLVNRLFDISLDLSGIAECGDVGTKLRVAEVIEKLDALVHDVRAAAFDTRTDASHRDVQDAVVPDAVADRLIIEQAAGMLSTRQKVDLTEAYRQLRDYAATAIDGLSKM